MAKKQPLRKQSAKQQAAPGKSRGSKPAGKKSAKNAPQAARRKAAPAKAGPAQPRRAGAPTTPQATIINPVTDSEVGRSFTVEGTAESCPEGTPITVRVLDGNTVKDTQTPQTDTQGTWLAAFSNIDQGNNYRITAQFDPNGLVDAEVTDIDVARFSINEPTPDSHVAAQCSVSGYCFDRTVDSSLTIDVTIEVPGEPDNTQPADTDDSGTWVAYFNSLSPGGPATVRAQASNSTHPDPVTPITVDGNSNPPLTITAPVDGQDFPEIDPPDPLAPAAAAGPLYEATGTFRKNFKVKAFVTRKGRRLACPIPVIDGGYVPRSTTRKNWRIELYKLFRKKAKPGWYHVHLVAINPDTSATVRYHRSSGKFRVRN